MKPGDRFGSLVYLGETDKLISAHGDGECWVALRCDCGTITTSYPSAIRSGRRTACAWCVESRRRESREALRSHPYWRTRHLRDRAHEAYTAALRSGELVRADECERCGARDTQIVGHHEDYSKPLDVMWLCHPCHGVRHGELGTMRRDMRAEAAS